jgi:segregation and condensation protein B
MDAQQPDPATDDPQLVEAAEPAPPDDAVLSAALECLLFMADTPLVPKDLGEMLGIEPERVCALGDRLAAEYDGRGVQIVRVAGGYQMCTRPEFSEYLAKLHEPRRFRLSRASMETLAIIAYRQPITRPEMEAVRGVNCDSVIDTLLDRGLVCERGRRDTPGRPMTYGTTPEFLEQFGLNSLRDLPELPELTSAEVEARLRAEGLIPEAVAEEGAPAEAAEPTPDGAAPPCHSEPFDFAQGRLREESRTAESCAAQGERREESVLPLPAAAEEGAPAEAVEPTPDGGAAPDEPPQSAAEITPAVQPGD